MKYALFIVQGPPTGADPHARDAWVNFTGLAPTELASARASETHPTASEQLSEGVWLLGVDSGLREMLRLQALADRYRCTTRVLFFEEQPQFVVTAP
jgi:hypothetical protein